MRHAPPAVGTGASRFGDGCCTAVELATDMLRCRMFFFANPIAIRQ